MTDDDLYANDWAGLVGCVSAHARQKYVIIIKKL